MVWSSASTLHVSKEARETGVGRITSRNEHEPHVSHRDGDHTPREGGKNVFLLFHCA